jgi:TRAP-type C4-dicarboxylate transport system substrate-binding protein
MIKKIARNRWAKVVALPLSVFLLAACSSAGTPSATEDAPEAPANPNPEVTLSVASTPGITDPVYYCGLEILEETIEAAGVGLSIELFPTSQLGPDTERFPALQAGDIDIDLQGASALSNSYPLM